MYYTHFGLTEAPFSIAPNPAYLFMTERHQEALAHLYHGIESDAGFVLLTGDVGTGKTTVCRRFLHRLPQNTQVAFILNPCVDRIELLQAIAKELNIPSRESVNLRQLTGDLHDYLLNNHAKGVNTVLLVDEAQQIHPPVLEFIRLLTNLETDKQKLLKIILVGQPELNDLLAQPSMVQLSQRITARFHIYPLTINEITHYIDHRLQVAGYAPGRPLFSPRRIKQLFTMTKGVPRLINVICDRALLGAYSQSARDINSATLTKAHQEVSGNYIASPLRNVVSKWAISAKLLLSIFCLVLIALSSALGLPKAIHFSSAWFDSASVVDVSDSLIKREEPISLVELPAVAPIIKSNESVGSHLVDDTKKLMTNDKLALEPTAIENFINNQALVEPVDEFQNKESEKIPRVSYYADKQDAVADLMRHIIPQSLPIKTSQQQECDRLYLLSFRCETVSEPSWKSFKKYNRPAVITLRDNDRLSHVVVVGVNDNYALVMAEKFDGEQQKNKFIFSSLSINDIENQWEGDATFIWQAPLGFEGIIFKESNSNLINWLATAFSTIDQKTETLAKNKYNRMLEKRIRFFQKKYELKEDGKAGMKTLLKLNEVLGMAIALDAKAVAVNPVTDQ
jgi:general secretion pathway protein A